MWIKLSEDQPGFPGTLQIIDTRPLYLVSAKKSDFPYFINKNNQTLI